MQKILQILNTRKCPTFRQTASSGMCHIPDEAIWRNVGHFLVLTTANDFQLLKPDLPEQSFLVVSLTSRMCGLKTMPYNRFSKKKKKKKIVSKHSRM